MRRWVKTNLQKHMLCVKRLCGTKKFKEGRIKQALFTILIMKYPNMML